MDVVPVKLIQLATGTTNPCFLNGRRSVANMALRSGMSGRDESRRPLPLLMVDLMLSFGKHCHRTCWNAIGFALHAHRHISRCWCLICRLPVFHTP